MMYLCECGPNIWTRCSDEMQISFFLPWVGYFGIVLDGKKSCHMKLQVYQSFKHIQFYLKYQGGLLIIIFLWSYGFNMLRNKKSLPSSLFCSLGGWDNYLIIPH